VEGTKGRVLCSGFWGLSRHINYMGEIVQVLGKCAPLVCRLCPKCQTLPAVPAFKQTED